ncbi:MAG: CotH kinase family protein [Prolixibacteraceae bacterium]|jgi:hypothetical protein|nr:CotH kinase family protein [Prolixibacteraceae bacterium]
MLRKLFGVLIVFFSICFSVEAQISLNFNSNYSYLKGSEANNLPSYWMTSSYNDSNWSISNAPFRYGDGNGGTVLSDMRNNYSTVYLRTKFEAQNTNDIENVSLNIDFDDGFIIWVNGKEVLSQNAPNNPSSLSFASDLHESGSAQNFVLDAKDMNLLEGENLLAIQLFNYNLESSDVYFDMEMRAIVLNSAPETSDSLKVIFSHNAGFYDQSFSLTMTVPDDSYTIRYTIDGSNPQTSVGVQNGGKSKTITINPASASGRAATPCFLVRASLVQTGLAPSKPTTQTYIFLDNVINQNYPGGAWPSFNVNGQYIDLEMDRDITNSSVYKSKMRDALLDLPSISIVTDIDNLFGATNGIYVNALQHGYEWERFCSAELINPITNDGFNINAGLRIRGGYSRHSQFPKHAFRLFFRSEYGQGKLKYPLFENEGVDEFDKIDLRTAQNYAWSNGDSRNTMVREVFARDSQRDMGQPYTRSRYYHLYLNGMYWGVFQTQERSEARFASSYFGGQPEDYDVVKVNGDNYEYVIEATDGNLDAWEEVWDKTQTGFSANSRYFSLEGKNAKGEAVKGEEKLVDVDNLIDYMISVFYLGSFDAPVSAFLGNQSPNNFYTILKRDDKTKGFVFFMHDAEHAMMIDNASPGIGLYENRVELENMNVNQFSKFHPQWLHQKLTENAEYRQRFADRAYKHLFNNGVFTPEIADERFMNRANEIELAMVAESARWGDSQSGNPYTVEDWSREINNVRDNFLPYRTDIVIDQLVDADLMNTINPPRITHKNEIVLDNRVEFANSIQLTLELYRSTGDIYITRDGSDPRGLGGNVSANAEKVENNKLLYITKTTWLKTRVKSGNNWSALREMHVVHANENFTNLKVTELNYHPVDSVIGIDTISGKSFEFIELKNTGYNSIDLSNLYFEEGINFDFKENAIVGPRQFYVLVSSSKWFFERYGVAPSGDFSGSLSNSGEQLRLLTNSNQEVFNFEYSDSDPWATEPDGYGYTLTSSMANQAGNSNEVNYWKVSTYYHGSPFHDDLGFKLDDEQASMDVQNILLYPNPTNNFLYLKLNGNENVFTEIYTLKGEKVFSKGLRNGAFIDLVQLNIKPGILLVKMNFKGVQRIEKILFGR